MDSYKQCPNCGKTFPAQDAFCDDCGCQLDWMPSTQPQQSFMPPPTQTTTAYYAEKPKKTGVLIGLLVAILLVLAAMIRPTILLNLQPLPRQKPRKWLRKQNRQQRKRLLRKSKPKFLW